MNDEQLSEWLSRRVIDEGGLTREFFALRAEIAKNRADYEYVLDSYAAENQSLHTESERLLAENERLREALEEAYNQAWLCDGNPAVRLIRTRAAKALGVVYPYAPQEIDPPR